MGRKLYKSEEVFREQVEWCAARLKEPLGLDLRHVLYPPGGMEQEAEEELSQPRIAQPALFVVEYALARLLMRWGIRADAMIGHGAGEYVAACMAEVMSPEDALWLVCRRGALMQEVWGGEMAAVMSGERAADHSSVLEGVSARYVVEVGRVRLRPGEIEYISSVTGRTARAEEVTDPAYWGRQMRECTGFSDGIEELAKRSGMVLLEVGPGEALSKLAGRSTEGVAEKSTIISTMRSQTDSCDDARYLTVALGSLWMAGIEIGWKRYYEGERRRRVSLPTYPFERRRYWIEAAEAAGDRGWSKTSSSLKVVEIGRAHV